MLSLFVLLACTGSPDAVTDTDDSGTPEPALPEGVHLVDLETTTGNVVLEVHEDWAPNGAARFLELVEAGFYDDSRFFRVIPDFVVQFGLSGDPALNTKWASSTIEDDPVVESNTRRKVTFAQTNAPNSRTTQIFINYGDNSRLDADGFAPFAEVVEGMPNVRAINAEYREQPNQVQIRSQGNEYLDQNFPNLDGIIQATIRP